MERATPIVAVIGPSGAGKSALVRELHRRGAVLVHPTWTTRPARGDERHGSLEHRFVSEAEFDRLAGARFFSEVVTPFGLPYRYGMPPVPDAGPTRGRPMVVMTRSMYLGRLRRHQPDLIVYAIEDDEARIQARLQARPQSGGENAARLALVAGELRDGRALADRVFRNHAGITELADAVEAALAADQRAAATLMGAAR